MRRGVGPGSFSFICILWRTTACPVWGCYRSALFAAEPYGTRYFPQTMDKLKEAMEVFNSSNLDFVIEMGDLKDQDNVPRRATDNYLSG